jgi:hypothetical protein
VAKRPLKCQLLILINAPMHTTTVLRLASYESIMDASC